jgi:hypothetical protein
MAQTTVSIPRSNFKVEVSLNGSSWTDISGHATGVNVSGGEQMTGEQMTAENQYPIVVATNKVSASTIEVSILYTESSSEAFQIVWGRYEGSAKTIYLRWSPKGGATADERYVCANNAGTAVLCPIVACLPPQVDAGSGDPAMAMFRVIAPRVLQEVVP